MVRKSILLIGLVLLVFVGPLACSQEAQKPKKVVAKINNCEVTYDEFMSQLSAEVDMNDDFKLTKQNRDKFLDRLIRKEVMIQEAKRLKLDTQEKFVRAIERYWESVLIRDLMELKGKEIASKAVISEEEIGTRYNELVAAGKKPPPMKESRPIIIHELKEEKMTRLLKEWVDEQIRKADIKINRELLYQD
jgi:hypothetical protein